jgi:hypothetical protein
MHEHSSTSDNFLHIQGGPPGRAPPARRAVRALPVGLANSVRWPDVRVCARSGFHRLPGCGVMTASLGYLFLRQVLQMLTQPARDDGAKDVELLVLRHPVAVLRRQVTRPQVEPADRVVPAARSRLLPPSRWPTVFVTPATPDPRWVDQRILAGSRSAIDLASPQVLPRSRCAAGSRTPCATRPAWRRYHCEMPCASVTGHRARSPGSMLPSVII